MFSTPLLRLYFAFIILVTITCLHNIASADEGDSKPNNIEKAKDWRWCVANIAKFYVSSNPTDAQPTMIWTEEGSNLCGFKMISMLTLQREAFFSKISSTTTRRHTFIGDSTSLRAYGSAVNEFFPDSTGKVSVGKVGQAPQFLSTSTSASKFLSTSGGDGDEQDENDKQKTKSNENNNNNNQQVEMRFVKMIHVSLWNTTMNYLFELERKRKNPREPLAAHLGGGMVSFSLGNWDLNWKLQPLYKIPGLGKKNLPSVMSYWSKNTNAMFDWLDENVFSFPATANMENPVLIFKEQLLPNCNTSRFEPRKLGKKLYHKRCKDLLSNIVIPMYRRVLAAQAWVRNIPVIPVDFLVHPTVNNNNNENKVCKMGDGIHLDGGCMLHEQQLIWNVYLLLKRRKVVQKMDSKLWVPFSRRNVKRAVQDWNSLYFLTATQALEKEDFAQWWCLQPWRTENDPLCSNSSSTSSTTQKSSTTSGDGSAVESTKETEDHSSSSTGEEQTPETTTGGKLTKKPNKKTNGISELIRSEANKEGNRDSHQRATDPSSAPSSNEQQKNNDANLPNGNYYSKVSPPGITDIWTVILIVLLPIVLYVGLRTCSNNHKNNSSSQNILEEREELRRIETS